MTELWLKFKDEKGEVKRLLVGKESFTIGRHSENDLSVPNGKLSREHLKINRFGDLFMVSDAGSSNGTTLNDKDLAEPTAIRNGDILDLGGGLKLKVEIESDDPNAATPPAPPPVDAPAGAAPGANGQMHGAGVPIAGANVGGVQAAPAANVGAMPAAPAAANVGAVPAAPGAANVGAVSATPAAASASGSSGGFPKLVFVLAPLLAIVVLVFVVGLFFLFSGSDDSYRDNRDDDFVYSNDNSKNDDDDTSNSKDIVTTKTPSNTTDATPTPGGTNAQPTPTDPGSSGKVEQNAASFLRNIADNEPRAFLTGDQAKIVDAKIKQLSSSSTLAENIKSANRSASQIKTLAASKNLKPQLVAAAAIAKLGSSRGDVLQTAQSMSEVLGKLSTQIGTERSDDSLLLIAAYDQGQAGEFLKMRNMLQDLAGKSTESSRAIRSIWFLQKNNKITATEFEFALRFLAIGTITQNPKDFGVNTDALGF